MYTARREADDVLLGTRPLMAHPSINETVGHSASSSTPRPTSTPRLPSSGQAEVATSPGERSGSSGRAEVMPSRSRGGDHRRCDDLVAELHLNYLIADGMTESLTKGMIALRERIGYGRSLMANEREADKLLARTERSPDDLHSVWLRPHSAAGVAEFPARAARQLAGQRPRGRGRQGPVPQLLPTPVPQEPRVRLMSPRATRKDVEAAPPSSTGRPYHGA